MESSTDKIYPSRSAENMKKYNKEYYQNNKAKILAGAVQKVKCDVCNHECSKSNMSKHIKTERHKLNAKIKQLEK